MAFKVKQVVFYIGLFCFIAGCATTAIKESHYREDSFVLMDSIRNSDGKTLFPVEFNDLEYTINRGEHFYNLQMINEADRYYLLAIGKAKLLREHVTLELQHRADLSIAAEEEKRKAAELADEEARKVMEARKINEEKIRLEELRRAEEARAKKALEARKRAERARAEIEKPKLTRYTVKGGESLPQIASRPEVYGDAALWPLLYKANRDQIRDPAVLWPGQVLRIPRNVEKSDLQEARQYSITRPIR
ncbi:MAG: LysM peptidoglycan-binding domain-containing protein [Desulfuromonadales bacterium]|nr:LysM peptidoglycan-binding domain-containing protein [Desulfuromonadales bacterium]